MVVSAHNKVLIYLKMTHHQEENVRGQTVLQIERLTFALDQIHSFHMAENESYWPQTK